MQSGLLITLYLASALTGSLIAGTVAPAKRRHAGYWVIFAFLVPPLVLLLLLLPRGRGNYRRDDPFFDEDDKDEI